MSDRSIPLPDRAFREMLGGLLAGSEEAARVQKWPGAARLALFDAGGGAPLAVPSITITTVLSLTLDPGRWVLYGGLYTSDASSAVGSRYTVNAWLNIPGEVPFKTSTTQYTFDSAYGDSQTTLAVARSIEMTDVAPVTLTVQPVTTITSVRLKLAYLLAVGY